MHHHGSRALSLLGLPSLRRGCQAWGLAVCTALGGLAHAAGDALAQPRCLEARAELDAALQASAQDRRAHAQRLARARELARMRCLGGGQALPAPPTRMTAQPGAPVQPVPPMPPGPTAPVAPMAPPQNAPYLATPSPAAPVAPVLTPGPPLAIPTPRVLGHCDGTGCWDNLGNRLSQGGGMTSSPNGLCSVQGNFAICP